jgi:hypothetical protein
MYETKNVGKNDFQHSVSLRVFFDLLRLPGCPLAPVDAKTTFLRNGIWMAVLRCPLSLHVNTGQKAMQKLEN